MNKTSGLLTATLIVLSVNVNAETKALTGTADLFDPIGQSIMGIPTVVTGEYDTDTQQITIDPWIFFGLPVNSQIQVLSPGDYSFPGVSPIHVAFGQLGGMITTEWAASIIPHAIVWDVISHPGGQHFEPIDSDGDGIPGQAMVSGPFPGFTMVYEFDTGEPAPGIDVEINIAGGSNQQCNEAGGNHVELTATVDLSGGAELASVDWEVDGNAAGSGVSITPFLSLGSHNISVTATGISGVYDTTNTSLQIVDTINPELSVEFIDTRTGEILSSVEGSRVTFVDVRLNGSDICDANVDVAGVAKPAFDISGDVIIKIQGNNNTVDMPASAIEVTATAVDDSGNKQLEQAILPIN